MVFINYSTKEISVKIVYYGPGLSGKTTNLQYIYKKTDKTFRGELVSLDTDTERTLFFDLLPMEVGKIRGFTTKIQLYTVPGQVHYNTTRKLVLKGVDGIVFVADSQKPILEANVENYKNMLENLNSNHINIDKIPLVFQYNKRDLNNILPIDDLDRILNPSKMPSFEAIAIKGKGVLETLREITRLTLHSVKKEVFGESVQDTLNEVDIEEKDKIKKNKEAKEVIEIDLSSEEITEEEPAEEIEERVENIEVEEVELIEEEEKIIKKEKEIKKEQKEKRGEEEEKEIEAKEKETKKERKEKSIEEEMKQMEQTDEKIKEKERAVKTKETPLSISNEKILIEKNLSLKIPSEKIIDSSHIYIQFINQDGDLIKKWKISKEKIKDGAILSLKVDIDIK